MNRNPPYQRMPAETPVVAQTVVIPPHVPKRRNYVLATFLIVMGILFFFGFIAVCDIDVFPFDEVPFFFIACLLLSCGGYLFYKGKRISSGQVVGPAQGATRAVGVPVVAQVANYPRTPAAPNVPCSLVSTYTYTPPYQPLPTQAPICPYPAAGQVINYPTTPAAPSVTGGLVSTYTYAPPNQPSAAQAPTYPYPGGVQAPNYPSQQQVSAPAYPYAGGQTPSYPMNQKPPVGASTPGFQAPPTAPSQYLPDYQPPPPYAPDENPPPYSR